MAAGGGRGAGRSGGLLFLAVVLLVAYLAVTAVAGFLRIVLGAAFVVVVIVYLANLLRRR